MAGQRAVRIAVSIAEAAEELLRAAGCPPPPRGDLVARLLPSARVAARRQKALRAAELEMARACRAAASAHQACEAVAEEICAGWLAERGLAGAAAVLAAERTVAASAKTLAVPSSEAA